MLIQIYIIYIYFYTKKEIIIFNNNIIFKLIIFLNYILKNILL